MNMTIYFRDTRTATVAGCTGNPTEVDAVVLNGYYRDQFTLEVDSDIDNRNKDIYFPGKGLINPNPEFNISVQTPPFVAGAGIVPTGDVTIERLTNDSESRVSVSGFTVAVSDEVAHAPLRQVQYQESYWAFPYTLDGVSGNAYFRKAVVDGWGPEPLDED